MTVELRQTIAAFVGASARYILSTGASVSQTRDDLYLAWDALVLAWMRDPP